MSKKNSKKRWTNQHQEMLKREREEAEKKAARAARKAEKEAEAAVEAAGGMLIDGGADALAPKEVAKKAKALKASKLKVSSAGVGKVSANKNTRKILKGVPVGMAQRKVKLRRGAVVRGIKITDADSKDKVINELKAEMAMGMMVDGIEGSRPSTKEVHRRRNEMQKARSKLKKRVTGNEFSGDLLHHKVKPGVRGG